MPRPGRFTPGKETLHPTSPGGPQDLSGRFGEEKISCSCLDSSVTVVTTQQAGRSGRCKISFWSSFKKKQKRYWGLFVRG